MIVPEFYPKQQSIVDDWSEYQLIVKGRRVGGTFALAYKHVAARLTGRVTRDLMFGSYNQRTANEFIRYVKQFCELFNFVAEEFDIDIGANGKRHTQTVVPLPNGSRVFAMPSTPDAIRGFGGDVILDEYSRHKDAEDAYDAAQPVIMRGGTLTVLATVKGKNNCFWEFLEDARAYRKGARRQGQRELIPWSLTELPLSVAVEDGLVEQINKFEGTNYTREEFVAKVRRGCRSQEQFDQEYECIPADDGKAWLTYALIRSCVNDRCPKPNAGLSPEYAGGPCYAGIDVGRTKDLTVLWLDELVGDVLWTRQVLVIDHRAEEGGVSIPEQVRRLAAVLRAVNLVRACVDYTGLGIGLGDGLVEALGEYRVENITFTPANKEILAVGLRECMEDGGKRIPADDEVREDLHRVQSFVTGTGKMRLDAARVEDHADRFWAAGLAVHAAEPPAGIRISLVGPPEETAGESELDLVEAERKGRKGRKATRQRGSEAARQEGAEAAGGAQAATGLRTLD